MVLTERLRQRARESARRMWTKYALRGVRQNDAHERLEFAYKLADPWHMDAERERFRFVETCRLIETRVGAHFDRLLEIGCGEGHQTDHLMRLADHVTGIDVSATAIGRARRRVPTATFALGDLTAQSWAQERGRFGLVTACEVLYYVSDIPALLRAMDHLGASCFATWFAPASRHCEAPVMGMPGAQQTRFRHDDTEWVAAWWTGAARRT
jgi:2-polyprenyl-3-methyl-5-hydroxy-6-metoxy-1,4-benzoquinol methylase